MGLRPPEHTMSGSPLHPVLDCPGRPLRVAVLGTGQMGLVCSALLVDGDRARGSGEAPTPRVTLWSQHREQADRLSQTRRSPRLEGFTLPDSVRVAIRDDQIADADLVVAAVPVQFMRSVLERLAPHLPPRAAIVSVAKGIENESMARPTQIIAQTTGADDSRLGVLTGPTIAAELAAGLPATMIAAARDSGLARALQRLFGTSWLRIYTHDDVVGVEVAGATKNIVAIAAGILDGLNAGNNAKSALLARGLAEITRLGVAMGAQRETFYGVAGVGDLATSCFSPEGRNRSCGEALGRGETLEHYLDQSPYIVEGVATTRSVVDLCKRLGVEMPITQMVWQVLFDELDPIEAIGRLMSRQLRGERERA